MESPDTDGSIPLLDTNCLPNKDHSTQASVYRKPAHTGQYLDWNYSHSVVHALLSRAVPPEILAKEMDYLHWVLKINYQTGSLKDQKRDLQTHHKPRLSELREPLQQLVKKNTEFVWMDHHTKAFSSLKEAISANCLVHFFTQPSQYSLS